MQKAQGEKRLKLVEKEYAMRINKAKQNNKNSVMSIQKTYARKAKALKQSIGGKQAVIDKVLDRIKKRATSQSTIKTTAKELESKVWGPTEKVA